MEEFIKEHEKEFLEYIEFEERTNDELSKLNKDIEDIESTIMLKSSINEKSREKQIEDKKDLIQQKIKEIYALNEEISKNGVAQEVNKIKNARLKESYITDFEIEKLKVEKKKIEDEVKNISSEILKIEKDDEIIKLKKEQWVRAQKDIKTKGMELEKQKSYIKELINQRICLKEKALAGISTKKQEEVQRQKDEIKEREEIIDIISLKKFEGKELNDLKQKTIVRLRKEVEEIRETLNKNIREFDTIKNNNTTELKDLQQLIINVDSGNTKRYLSNILSINIDNKMKEDLDKFFDEQCQKDSNLSINETGSQSDENFIRVWDKNGNGIKIIYPEEETTFIEKIKNKMLKLKNKIGKKVKEVLRLNKNNGSQYTGYAIKKNIKEEYKVDVPSVQSQVRDNNERTQLVPNKDR